LIFATEHGMSVRRTGSGPELVWIHGLGESSMSFDPPVATMPGWTHVLPDLPGHGRSLWGEPLALTELAGQLAAWLAERPPAYVIGHSMGGVLATLIAERTPVRGIVDIEGNLSAGDCMFSGRAAAYTLDDFVARGFATLRDHIFDESIAHPAMRVYHAALVFASPRAFHRHAQDLVALSKTEELAPRLARLTVPVLYVAGAPDGICARSHDLLAQHRIRAITVAPAGHWVYADQPARFAAALAAFLRGA
jgi:pimeloyl-ACP methyl ester carboxylesterase